MRFRTFAEHRQIADRYPYYRGRWGYMRSAIEMLTKESFDSVLELGPGPSGLPIIHGADTMWQRELSVKPTYQHDATVLPWPIKDRRYDLFVALQVFEHLEGKQVEVFQEVQRIARMALLSLPYQWGKPGEAHHVTDTIINYWTGGLIPTTRQMTKSNKRILLFYEFGNGS